MSEGNKTPISEVIGITMQKVKEMVDAETIIGDPIKVDDVTLIPVSKISVGFASGGSGFGAQDGTKDGRNFAGGGGAGITITPVVFLVVSGGNVRILSVDSAPRTTTDRILDLLPQVVSKVEDFISARAKGEDDKGE